MWRVCLTIGFRGINSFISLNSSGAWNGYYQAYIGGGIYDTTNFSNIERFQITGTGVVGIAANREIIWGDHPNNGPPQIACNGTFILTKVTCSLAARALMASSQAIAAVVIIVLLRNLREKPDPNLPTSSHQHLYLSHFVSYSINSYKK